MGEGAEREGARGREARRSCELRIPSAELGGRGDILGIVYIREARVAGRIEEKAGGWRRLADFVAVERT